FFNPQNFQAKIFKLFFSPASASALPFGKRVQKYSIFSYQPNKNTVFFDKISYPKWRALAHRHLGE
ncbi:MAG: hypothetical protein IJR06_05615, partial [Paludibacteraceae bacterium]|nr:hypothetical protein [Paludibacteraceae bacterium]